MAERGGFPDLDFSQLVPQQPQGLLSMAGGGQRYGSWAPPDYSAIMQSLNGGGGGGGGSNRGGQGGGPGDSGGGFGPAPISPEDKARYFDASGEYKIDDPRQVAADAGISVDQLGSGFMPRYGANGIGYDFASDLGGFFNLEAMSRLNNRPIPGVATHRANSPSTNNWRLLGMGPGWIMRNGSVINTRAPETTRGAPIGQDLGLGITAEHGMSAQRGSSLGTGGSMGMPNRWGDSFYWPGSVSGGFSDRWPAYTNV